LQVTCLRMVYSPLAELSVRLHERELLPKEQHAERTNQKTDQASSHSTLRQFHGCSHTLETLFFIYHHAKSLPAKRTRIDNRRYRGFTICKSFVDVAPTRVGVALRPHLWLIVSTPLFCVSCFVAILLSSRGHITLLAILCHHQRPCVTLPISSKIRQKALVCGPNIVASTRSEPTGCE
jgi:hypothetical protein